MLQFIVPYLHFSFIFTSEKNPGLFLQAAHEILQAHPFARFTIVGDGVLRGPLEELAARLQISWAVHFTGWASAADLPKMLAGVDIVINPSLRAWSEYSAPITRSERASFSTRIYDRQLAEADAMITQLIHDNSAAVSKTARR